MVPFYDEERYRRIPYEEYKAINELVHAHLHTHNGKLRALIAFGEIVTRGGTFDIDLLEVVDGWEGQSSVTFSSSEALPLRGQLRLHLLTPEEFEESDGGMHLTEKRLLERVREGYEIVYEAPPRLCTEHIRSWGAERRQRQSSGVPRFRQLKAGMISVTTSYPRFPDGDVLARPFFEEGIRHLEDARVLHEAGHSPVAIASAMKAAEFGVKTIISLGGAMGWQDKVFTKHKPLDDINRLPIFEHHV